MEIRIPEIGESVHEALVAKWLKQNGDYISRDEPLCEIETDKITLDLNAEISGVLSILVDQGTTVQVGTVIGMIKSQTCVSQLKPSTGMVEESPLQLEQAIMASTSSPLARLEMRASGVHPEQVAASGRNGRIMPEDVIRHVQTIASGKAEPVSTSMEAPAFISPVEPVEPVEPVGQAAAESREPPSPLTEGVPFQAAGRGEKRLPMTPIRKRIAERLLAARQQTAMLTTFTEVDVGRIHQLREQYRERFLHHYGVKPGLMPFFVAACIRALREYPLVNARIDGDDIVYYDYFDIGIAIGGEKGLVVPVLRNADRMRMHEIDQAIAGFIDKIKRNQLSISDLEGGTFTISNGGVYGSLMSTPILNPPQSGVLGMHAIQDRPVVRDGQIVIRPMMYLALSYDHRIIDGRDAVGFLRKVKESLEEAQEQLLEG